MTAILEEDEQQDEIYCQVPTPQPWEPGADSVLGSPVPPACASDGAFSLGNEECSMRESSDEEDTEESQKAAAARWLSDKRKDIKFSILPLEKGESAVSFRLSGRTCLEWAEVRAELLDRIEIPRAHHGEAHLGCTYVNWTGVSQRVDEESWGDILKDVSEYMQQVDKGKNPKSKVGKLPLCFKVSNAVSNL
jgi:hypothetical protein